ncbi:MAG TPA: hypothetical protein VHH32_02955 [Gemmatimonadales bacterium]|nr:hypothetical protein [Gemmatimonadales bacterium]
MTVDLDLIPITTKEDLSDRPISEVLAEGGYAVAGHLGSSRR